MFSNDLFFNKNVLIFDQMYYTLVEKGFISINSSLLNEWYSERKSYCKKNMILSKQKVIAW